MAEGGNKTALATTTLENYVSTKLEDNIFKGVKTLNAIRAKGGLATKGGTSLLYPLLYAKNTTVKTMTPYGVFDMTPQEGITDAEYDWANMGGTVVMDNFTREVMNAGDSKVIDLLDAKVKQLEMSMRDYLNYSLWTARGTGTCPDGTARNGAYEMWSLVDAVSTYAQTDPSYTGFGTGYGKIPIVNATGTGTNVWWRSMSWNGTGVTDPTQLDMDGVTSGLEMPTASAVFNLANLGHLIHMCSDGSESPNLIIMPLNIYEKFQSLLISNVRYNTDKDLTEANLEHIVWNGVPIIWDKSCTAGVVYALNTNFLKFIHCSGRDMKASPFVTPVNQDVISSKVVWSGQLACSNRALQGKWSGVTAA